MSTTEAAVHADVDGRTIRRWITLGRLKTRKAGRVLRVDLDELEALLVKDGRRRGGTNGGTLRSGAVERDLSPEERAARDFGA